MKSELPKINKLIAMYLVMAIGAIFIIWISELGKFISPLGVVFGAATFVASLLVLNYLVLIMFKGGPILLAITLIGAKFMIILGGAYIASQGDRPQVLGFIAGLLLFLPATVFAPKPKI